MKHGYARTSECLEDPHAAVGEYAADRLFSLDAHNIGGYLQLSNLYAFARLWDCVAKIRGIDEGEKTDKRPRV